MYDPVKLGVKWHVGEFSTYIDNEGETYRYSIVGSKELDGKTYYWIEMFGKFRDGSESTALSLLPEGSLFLGDAKQLFGIVKFGVLPLDVSPSWVRSKYRIKRIGSGEINIPAGKFQSEHLRLMYNDGRVDDLWINKEVGPQGITKAIIREKNEPEKIVVLKEYKGSGAKPTLPHLLEQ